ncbi:hypothetical protein NliqN6_4201 [Naganishia liquefaciens]|uniref:Uncharacterized protein n=1 Tax=Naganishia liquefaciens TaxID=104408 RepID=A0A8H3TX38_9TREE|nr:hypothetical protein NliqN6_4201 [Naganishia liquefaciens]
MPSQHRHRHRHTQEPQPPSTLKVLSYVALVWAAWGIFTRIDETDHLRPPETLRHAASTAAHVAHDALYEGERAIGRAWDGYEGLRRSNGGVYSLAFPPVSSSSIGRAQMPEDARGGWLAMVGGGMRTLITYGIVYPAIALFNAAAFALHYLSITFLMLLTSAYYLAYPLQQLAISIASTLFAPLTCLASLVRYTQPLWSLTASLLTTSATLGTAFALLGRKADARIHAAHAQRLEREKVEQLEREVAAERARADEQERRARELLQQRMISEVRHHRRHHMAGRFAPANGSPKPPPPPPPQSLLSALIDKLCGRVSLQEEYAAYVADLALLEPGSAQGFAGAWREPYASVAGVGSGDDDEEAYAVPAGPRLMIAPADGHLKRRHVRRSENPRQVTPHVVRPPTRHAPARPATRETSIPDMHLQPPHTHIRPDDGLPTRTGRRIDSSGIRATGASGIPEQARRAGGRRIMWEDQVARQVEDPIEREVFGVSDDDGWGGGNGDEEENGELADDNDNDDERAPPRKTVPSSLHIHIHNSPSSVGTSRRPPTYPSL